MAQDRSPTPERKLGFLAVFCVASGAMISSGLFVLPGQAFRDAGPAMILSYGLAALLMIPAVLSVAELAAAMPRSGGSYFFIERSMGALTGLLAGLANWFSISLKSAFALIGIGAFARLVHPEIGEWTIKIIALGACVVFMTLNLLGAKRAGRLQVVMVAALLGSITYFILGTIPQVRHDHFAGFMDAGLSRVFATAGLVFVSYGGLTKIASIAGEIRDPGRIIPAGMFAAYAVVSILYVVVVFAVVGVTPAAELVDPVSGRVDMTPLCTAAGQAGLGAVGVAILAAGGMLAFFTTANSGILSASRSPLAMARDNLLPAALGRVWGRTQTPWVAVLLTSVFIAAVTAALSIADLVKVASTMMLVLLLLVNAAVLIMRGSGIQNYRPTFRSPLFPWLQLAGIALYAFLITEMGRAALLATAAFALAGVGWYFLYVRSRAARQSALAFMVRKIVSKDFVRADLEGELRQIALERDEVIHDRFDHLVARCPILDLPAAAEADEVFRKVAEVLADRLHLPAEELLAALRQREQQSSTVVQPGLAIPHAIVPGEGRFEVALVRCRDGIHFAGQSQPVRTCFVLACSADERNYYLRALMAIAHIASEHDFARRWLAAPGGEHLRDIVLLSKRRRDDHHDAPTAP
jgi:APA family basic amino acid/polyamine antiporter